MAPILYPFQLQTLGWCLTAEKQVASSNRIMCEGRGGFIAEEMGLGKTIETVALILSNPRPATESRATLIVMPRNLVAQWESEITNAVKWRGGLHPGQCRLCLQDEHEALLCRPCACTNDTGWHPDHLRRYKKFQGQQNKPLVCEVCLQPWQNGHLNVIVHHPAWGYKSVNDMQNADIVLTTFDVMSPGTGNRKRMQQSRALHAVDWWRVIVDEAQQVGGVGTQRLDSCMGLKRVHSWLVSGTPFDSLHTLLSQLNFLKVKLPAEVVWQRDVIDVWGEQDAASGLYSVRAQAAHAVVAEVLEVIMCRHSKDQVDHQILLEPTVNHTMPIDFVSGSSHELIYRCMERFAEAEKTKVMGASDHYETLRIRELSLVASHPSTINLASLALRLPRLQMENHSLVNVPQLPLQTILPVLDPKVRDIVETAPGTCIRAECLHPFAPTSNRARILLMCGHSLCKLCAGNFFESDSDTQQRFCPICATPVKSGLLKEVISEASDLLQDQAIILHPPDDLVLAPLTVSVCDSASAGDDAGGRRAGCIDGRLDVRMTKFVATMLNGATCYFCTKNCAVATFAQNLKRRTNDHATLSCSACSKRIVGGADLVSCEWRAKEPNKASGKMLNTGDLFFPGKFFCKNSCAKAWFQGPWWSHNASLNSNANSGRPLYQPGLYERDNLREIEGYTDLTLRSGGIISKMYSEGLMQFPVGYVPRAHASRGAFLAHFDLFGQRTYGLDNGSLYDTAFMTVLHTHTDIRPQRRCFRVKCED